MNFDEKKEPDTKKYELPNKPIVPATYPDWHDKESGYPISSNNNVEYAKEWVDHNIK